MAKTLNNKVKQIVVDSKTGRIVDILDERENSSMYRSKKAYNIFTMDQELFDRLNTSNPSLQGFDPRGTMDIPTQRRASSGGSSDDGWFYRAIVGCGDFTHDERVEIDKVRAHTRSDTSFNNPPGTKISPFYSTAAIASYPPPGLKWNGITQSCAAESIKFEMLGSIVLPSRGGNDNNGSTLDNWLISGWFWPKMYQNDKIILAKMDTSEDQGYTGPESGTSAGSSGGGGFTGGSGDSFKLSQHTNTIKFHWTDAADTGTTGLLNNVSITEIITGTTGPTSGAQIPRHQWFHLAVGYLNSAAGSTVTAYVNGIRTVNQSTNGGGIKLNPHPFSIGARFNPGGSNDLGNRWKGNIDELVIGVTSGPELWAGMSGLTLTGTYQNGANDGSTAGLGDEAWQAGYAYYLPCRGLSGCNLFDVQSGENPGVHRRNFFEGLVTNWNSAKGRLMLRNTTGTGDFDYPTIGGGFITGMSCAAHYAIQSTGGNTGSGGSGGLDIVDISTYKDIIRNTLSSDSADLDYVRLYGQTHNPGPTGSSTNSFCTLFFNDGSCGGFSGTTGYFGPAGETHTGATGGGSFSFVRRADAMNVVGELVASINAGTSSGSCGAYSIENAEGESVRFTGPEVIKLWNDLTEFRRANNENEKARTSEITTNTALTDGKKILDARVTSLANGTSITVGKGTFVALVGLSKGDESGYGFSTGP